MVFSYEPRNTLLDRSNDAVQALAKQAQCSPYYPRYHIAAPGGWINDPNGLVYADGVYHVYYQHYPYGPDWGPMHWGHVSGTDLAHWKHHPIAMAPDQPYEKGCFSGSAVTDGGVITVFYTADDPDNPIKETQCLARSYDGGMTLEKSPLNPVIPTYPEDGQPDFRDPKVWKEDGRWQMVVGSGKDGVGNILLYASDDLEKWEYRGVMCESDGTQGWMWECPNFFRADGQDLLIYSPMGLGGQKCHVLFGDFDCAAGRMTQRHYHDVDYGENFYAPQVLELENRTLLFGWMSPNGAKQDTRADQWQGCLTVPRELHVRNGRLIQRPVRELGALRTRKLLEADNAAALDGLTGDVLELKIALGSAPAALVLSDGESELLRVRVEADCAVFAMNDGSEKNVPLSADSPREIHLFVDRCASECFIGGGEIAFSRYIYPKDNRISYRLEGEASFIEAWSLGGAFE